ncbi:MAG: hypothetical protein B7Z15_23335 [Rhizobiales bacterium 32-66-8]|nr:MAG: hypothetical protein B7Z15_23335 [Rhizobiales bacterium 32-66-8]
MEPSRGLQDFLGSDQQDNLTSLIARDTLTNATVIVGARRSDSATDQLLAGPAFSRLIRAARSTFDIIIIDTPPVGPVVDSLYIANHADAIVFVTRWSSTSQQEAKHSVASLTDAKRPDTDIIAVINQQDQSRASYMRKYGDYYADAD